MDYNGKIEKVITKRCPLCKRNYIHVTHFKDMSRVGIGKLNYYNLNLNKNSIREELVIVSKPGVAQTVYQKKSKVLEEQKKMKQKKKAELLSGSLKTSFSEQEQKVISKAVSTSPKASPVLLTKDVASGYVYTGKIKKVIRCVDRNCGAELSRIVIMRKNRTGKIVYNEAMKCPACGKYYIHWRLYDDNPEIMKCLNEQYLNDIRRLESLKTKKDNTKITTTSPTRPVRIKTEVLNSLKMNVEKLPAKETSIHANGETSNSSKTNSVGQKTKESNIKTIQISDFVVRRNIFKCMHKEHSLVNVNAAIDLINKDGKIIHTTVSAGYCRECNTYFIMESTFQNLKKRGTPICRISDEKAYLKGASSVNGMKLARESMLMQYGYNVSQLEGLTMTRRHKILAVLIDNNIMTKSEIISYLDFFINQRQSRHMFEKAIEKWNIDKEFVDEYKVGRYSTVGVSGIYRR